MNNDVVEDVAQRMRAPTSSIRTDGLADLEERCYFIQMAPRRKRHRFQFFILVERPKRRMEVTRQTLVQKRYVYCKLCHQDEKVEGPNRKISRGHL